MKYLFLLCTFVYASLLQAQTNGVREIEPGQKTSFENYELWIIAIAGLLLLVGLWFWFKRTRKH